MKETILRIIEMLVTILSRVIGKPPATLSLRFGLPTNKAETKNHMTEITITNTQKVRVTLVPTTQSGRPAQIDGTPEWEVQSGNATVEPVDDDALSADLISGDDAGVSEIIVKADADLGEGKTEVGATIVLTVEGERATTLGVTIGTPVPKDS